MLFYFIIGDYTFSHSNIWWDCF